MATKTRGRPRIHEQQNMVAIMTKVPKSLVDQLDALAKQSNRTRSGLVFYILKTQIQNQKAIL